MRPPDRDEAKRWLAQSQRDLAAAGVLKQAGHFNLACFHSQQAATTFRSSLATLVKSGEILDKFYIPTRYPNGLPGGLPSDTYTRSESADAIRLARRILNEVAKLLR